MTGRQQKAIASPEWAGLGLPYLPCRLSSAGCRLLPAAMALLLAASLLGASATTWAGEGELGRPAGLEPGFGAVQSREQRELRLHLDPDTDVLPAQLQGQTLVLRRLTQRIYPPQSWRPLAEEWLANGTAEVLATKLTGGAPVAVLLWEDEKNPVKAGDRAELCRVPADAGKPTVLSLQCVPARRPKGAAAVVAPAEEVWLVADLFCPTGEPATCEWTADAGEFVHAGGASAGKTLQGPPLVRWRAPVGVGRTPAPEKATVRLSVLARWHPPAVEQSLAIRIEEAKTPYVEEQQVAARVPGLAGGKLGPLFSDASQIAPGALGSFYLADGPNRRLLHWSQKGARYVAMEKPAVAAFGAAGDAVWLLQGTTLFRWKLDSEKLEKVAGLPDIRNFAGLRVNAAGDVYALDSSPPRVFRLAGGETWREAPLGSKVDVPGLSTFCLDPVSNDLYLLDTRDRMMRPWRALSGISYHVRNVAAPVGKALDEFGPPVEVVPRPDRDRALDLPIQLVFKSGAITEKWACGGAPPKWEPVVVRAPRALADMRFAAQRAVALSDGDLLIGGQATVDGETAPILAQLSPRGELRRMLPLPEMPPRCVAAAPDGLRYVLHVRARWGGGSQRLVRLGSDGWVARDLGPIESVQSIARVRADRSSSDHVFLVGERGSRESVFRVSAEDPKLCLELSYAGIPGAPIPKHRAVDVASSPKHVVVLDRDGKVLLFANEKPVRYLGEFDTGLRRPAAIALVSASEKAGESGADPASYFCVLPSGREGASLHVWRFRIEGGTKPIVAKVGLFPDPARQPAALLSSPVTMDTGFPDRPDRLYVLDRSGAQVRAFDVPEIAAKIAQGLLPELAAAPLLDKLPFEGGRLDLAIGPGQVIHIADERGEAVHTFARRP